VVTKPLVPAMAADVAPVSTPSGLKVAIRLMKLSLGLPFIRVCKGPTTTSPSVRSVTKA
jgi:hypothetical protein